MNCHSDNKLFVIRQPADIEINNDELAFSSVSSIEDDFELFDSKISSKNKDIHSVSEHYSGSCYKYHVETIH